MGRTKKTNPALAALRSVGLFRIITFSILGLIGAWFATTLALSGVTRIKAPQSALLFMPRESTALAARADLLFFANPQQPPEAVRMLSLAALREQAINPRALRLLGYYADVEGDSATAEKFIRMAQRLSRRDAATQLWLIEAYARENDTKQTLVHYDIALRTKPDTQTILFPRLLNAIEDEDIRTALKPYIRAENGWGGSFLFHANANSKNLPALTDLVVETGGLVDPKAAKNQEQGLLSRLVSEKYFADAKRLFLQMSGAKPARMTSAAFDPSDRDARFGAMGWQLIDDPDAGGGFTGKAADRQIALSLFANSGTTRPVATKLLYLNPGSYMFSARLAHLDRGDGGFLRWQLRCPSDASGAPLWMIDSINASLRATFAVPANCPVQFLDLIASGGKGQTGLEATVAAISVASTAK
jgi:tetratricopeptide (TPR) repeat protein